MSEKVEFIVNEQLCKKFKIALMLSGDDENKLAEEWIQKYVQRVFSKEAGVEVEEEVSQNNTINKIRKWANKNNIPHQIIKIFLLCYDESSQSAKKMDMIDKFIFMNSNDDIKQIESLRKKFNDNYSQMKSNGPHAHGNVFYDQGGNVYLVEDIKREIFKLKDNFLS